MKSSEKQVIINNLQEQIDSYSHFYLTDISGLNAENTSNLRRLCYKQDVKLVVVKNTLLRKALESSNKNVEEIYDALKGNTSVMFSKMPMFLQN
jgi:large subunit ribosomal protein L10